MLNDGGVISIFSYIVVFSWSKEIVLFCNLKLLVSVSSSCSVLFDMFRNAISARSWDVLSLIGSKLLFRNYSTAENASLLTSHGPEEILIPTTRDSKLNLAVWR